MAYTKREKQLILGELKKNNRLLTKYPSAIKRKQSGRYVQVIKERATGKEQEVTIPKNYLDFKLKVARSR